MGEGAQLGLKSRKKMTSAAELLGSEHNMSESTVDCTRHELLKNGSSSDLVNIHSAIYIVLVVHMRGALRAVAPEILTPRRILSIFFRARLR